MTGIKKTLYEGKFVRFVDLDGWEFVERHGASGIVIIIAVTDARRLVLVEQFRPAMGKQVVELPAGLAGDIEGQEDEALITAATLPSYAASAFSPSPARDTQSMVFLSNGVIELLYSGEAINSPS